MSKDHCSAQLSGYAIDGIFVSSLDGAFQFVASPETIVAVLEKDGLVKLVFNDGSEDCVDLGETAFSACFAAALAEEAGLTRVGNGWVARHKVKSVRRNGAAVFVGLMGSARTHSFVCASDTIAKAVVESFGKSFRSCP